MKTNEIITEVDWRSVGSTVAGAVKSPFATVQGLMGRAQGSRRVFDTTNRVFAEWSRKVTNMDPTTTDINQAIVSFADQVFQDRIAPGKSKVKLTTRLTKSQNGPMRQYLEKRAKEYWADLGTPAPPAPPPPPPENGEADPETPPPGQYTVNNIVANINPNDIRPLLNALLKKYPNIMVP